MMRNFSIIVAMDQNQGIGKFNTLAWHLPADLKHFKAVTTEVSKPGHRNAVIMGRKTWESLPEKCKPLPGRLNVVLSRQNNLNVPAGVQVYSSLDKALEGIEKDVNVENIFVIGGSLLYNDSIKHPNCQKLYITEIQKNFVCDAFFPEIPKIFKKITVTDVFYESDFTFRFVIYQK